MTMTGEMTAMLDVLGLPLGDDRALEAMALVGLPTERDEFRDSGLDRTYLVAREAGTDFVFNDGELTSVIVRTQPKGDYAAYPRPDALIDGLAGTATRDEVLARFGEPVKSTAASDRFAIDGRFLHFEYDATGHVARLTAMSRAPGS